jgi:YgiT-type zinc finger domain-containing protein
MGFKHERFICPNCHMGHMDLRLTTYVQQYGGTLISVPNTPAWICDVCHARQFDDASIRWIEAMIGQAGPPPNRHEPRKNRQIRHATEQPTSAPAQAESKVKQMKSR